MISYLYFLRANNTNHLPTSFYFLGLFFFSNHKSNTWILTIQTCVEQKKKRKKSNPMTQQFDFLESTRETNLSAQTYYIIVCHSKQNPETF